MNKRIVRIEKQLRNNQNLSHVPENNLNYENPFISDSYRDLTGTFQCFQPL